MTIKLTYFQLFLVILLNIVLLGLAGYKFIYLPLTQKPQEAEQNNLSTTQEITANYVDPQRGVLGGCDDGSRALNNGKSVATQKSSDGIYEATAFGCYTGEDPGKIDTPGCQASCDNPPGECEGLNKHDCMYKLKWFAANADQYGCHNKVKVTNPENGKSVILVIYDVGPACFVQTNRKVFDMSYPAAFHLGVGNNELVKVEEVPKDTPLGPTDGSAPIPGGTTGGGTGPVTNLSPLTLTVRLKPEVKDTYIVNRATATAIGGGTGGTTGGGSNGPVNPDATCPGVGPVTCGTAQGSPTAPACHCTQDYQQNVCGAPCNGSNEGICGGECHYCKAPNDSAAYAIDITNPLDAPVYIPKISVNGQAHTVTCKGYSNETGYEPKQVIQVISCADDVTDRSIWMQFHHSKKTDPFELVVNATYKSGDVIGHSGPFEVFKSGPHVHFQMGDGGPCGYGPGGTLGCVDPSYYVQCNG